MRVYVCPEHPEKTYTSWRKFRGHWSTQHRGEECPPREEFMQEMDRSEVEGEKKEKREEKKEKAEAKVLKEEAELPGEFVLPEEPAPRLAKILEVHAVPPDIIAQILGVFQLHPAYRDNPTNLHYLLTAKLPRKLHPSIPMMTSAFMTPDASYPEGFPGMMMPGMQGPGMMPPFMMGGGYSPYYPPTYGLSPFYRPPISGREATGEEEGERGGRGRTVDPVKDAMALLQTLQDFQKNMLGEEGKGRPTVEEVFEGFRESLEEITKEGKDQQDKVLDRMERMQESHSEALKGIETQLHLSQLENKQAEIDRLKEEKSEEQSEGLGTLLREAGEGVGSQVEGLRQNISSGLDRIGDIVEKVVSTEGTVTSPTKKGRGRGAGDRTVADASQILEVESEIEGLAKDMQGG